MDFLKTFLVSLRSFTTAVCFSIMSGISTRDSWPSLRPRNLRKISSLFPQRSARVCGKNDRRTGKTHHSSAPHLPYNIRQQAFPCFNDTHTQTTPPPIRWGLAPGRVSTKYAKQGVVSAVSLRPAQTRHHIFLIISDSNVRSRPHTPPQPLGARPGRVSTKYAKQGRRICCEPQTRLQTRLQTANYFVLSCKGFSPGSCSGIGNRRRFHSVNCGMSDCSGKH